MLPRLSPPPPRKPTSPPAYNDGPEGEDVWVDVTVPFEYERCSVPLFSSPKIPPIAKPLLTDIVPSTATLSTAEPSIQARSEERRVGKSVDLGGGRIVNEKKSKIDEKSV